MALIKTEMQAVFDPTQIHRGDCVRIRRAGDTDARNGFVTEAAPGRITVLYCNIQNNSNSYIQITAADAALGAWEIMWTSDFESIGRYPEDSQEDSAGGNTGGDTGDNAGDIAGDSAEGAAGSGTEGGNA